MSSTRQHHEVRSERIVRSSGNQKPTTPLDNNLDNLLEDLQNSISKPGGTTVTYNTTQYSNGGPTTNGKTVYNQKISKSERSERVFKSSGGTLASTLPDFDRQVEFLKPANQVTVPMESTTWVETEKSKDGNKEKTVYKTQKYEYSVSDKTDKVPIYSTTSRNEFENNINQLDSLLDDLQQVKNGPSNGIDSNKTTTKKVQRELIYDDEKYDTHGSRSKVRISPTVTKRGDREGSITRETTIQTVVDDGTYGNVRRDLSPNFTKTEIREYSDSRNSSRHTDKELHPEILKDLDPHLLPGANTKVTTTIKTYTYEIPGTPVTDTSISNYQSRVQSPGGLSGVSGISGRTTPSVRQEFYEYNKSEVVDKNLKTPEPVLVPDHGYPKKTETYVYEQDVQESYGRGMGPGSYPSRITPSNTTERIIYEKDVRDVHTMHYPNPTYQSTPMRAQNELPGDYPRPTSPSKSVNYEYKSEYNQYNTYGSPRLGDRDRDNATPKFPVNGNLNGNGPPKRLDDLMAQFDSTEVDASTYRYNRNVQQHENEKKREVELVDDGVTKRKNINNLPVSKNVAGPPVYYPPGHEMFAKKEEASAAYAAGGGYQKASGKYEYESGAKSKSSSKSGAAVVPVCLPLCCAMPCTIL